MKITKFEFDCLYHEDIYKREFDIIISKVNDRFIEICRTIITMHNLNRGWFAYGNVDYHKDGSEGEFDIDEYKEYISIGGEYINIPEPFCNEIPTRWLWEDFEEEFKKEVEDFKNKKELKKQTTKSKRVELKERKSIFKEIIKLKLTKEELKYIIFK